MDNQDQSNIDQNANFDNTSQQIEAELDKMGINSDLYAGSLMHGTGGAYTQETSQQTSQ